MRSAHECELFILVLYEGEKKNCGKKKKEFVQRDHCDEKAR